MISDDPATRLSGNLVVVQRNPTSGSGRNRRALRVLIQKLRARQLRVRMFSSREQLDRYLTRDTVQDNLRCLVAAGGDGTVASLIARHPTAPIAVFPMGTENLLARHLNMPCDGHVVASAVHHGHVRTFDTGRAGGSRFLLMASAGFDAAVVHQLHRVRSGNIRHLSYVKPLIRALLCYRMPRIQVIDHETGNHVVGSHVVVSNFREYALNLRLNPNADPTDGQLDVCVLQFRSMLRTAGHLFLSLFRTQTGPQVVRFRSRHLTVTQNDLDDRSENSSQSPAAEIPVQTDGDPAGSLPMEFAINPSTMRLVVHPR